MWYFHFPAHSFHVAVICKAFLLVPGTQKWAKHMKTPTCNGPTFHTKPDKKQYKLEKSCIESLRVTRAKKKSKAGQKIEDVKDGLGLLLSTRWPRKPSLSDIGVESWKRWCCKVLVWCWMCEWNSTPIRPALQILSPNNQLFSVWQSSLKQRAM